MYSDTALVEWQASVCPTAIEGHEPQLEQKNAPQLGVVALRAQVEFSLQSNM